MSNAATATEAQAATIIRHEGLFIRSSSLGTGWRPKSTAKKPDKPGGR
jgi:hypothetical protein